MEENKEKIKVIIVEDSSSPYYYSKNVRESFIYVHEIPSMLENGYESVIRLNNGEIEYADYNEDKGSISIIWKKPDKLED